MKKKANLHVLYLWRSSGLVGKWEGSLEKIGNSESLVEATPSEGLVEATPSKRLALVHGVRQSLMGFQAIDCIMS